MSLILMKLAFFYNLLPDRTLEFKGIKCHDGTKSKDRVTVVACCNADGSEKMPMWIIGQSKNPCFLSKLNCMLLPCEYTYHRQSRIDASSFHQWLINFQRKMACQDYKVLLTIDNCSAHKIHDLELKNVHVVFFPHNTTSHLQPLDQGITFSLKH